MLPGFDHSVLAHLPSLQEIYTWVEAHALLSTVLTLGIPPAAASMIIGGLKVFPPVLDQALQFLMRFKLTAAVLRMIEPDVLKACDVVKAIFDRGVTPEAPVAAPAAAPADPQAPPAS